MTHLKSGGAHVEELAHVYMSDEVSMRFWNSTIIHAFSKFERDGYLSGYLFRYDFAPRHFPGNLASIPRNGGRSCMSWPFIEWTMLQILHVSAMRSIRMEKGREG